MGMSNKSHFVVLYSILTRHI